MKDKMTDSSFDLNQFVKELENFPIKIQQQDGYNINLNNLAKDLVQNNIKQFSFILTRQEDGVHQRKIERIYSKNEIRKLVCENLIADYQNEQIINAVTEFLYGIHVSS